MSQRRGTIKPLLTDQGFIAGIGNCYSDEILFGAGLKPDRKANEFNPKEIKQLFSAIPKVLREAIANGGYMEKPFSMHDQLTGGHNEHLKVYDREGRPCLRCADKIELTTLSGKKSFFCPSCQH